MARIIVYSNPEMWGLEFKTCMQNKNLQVLVDVYDDERMFKYAVEAKEPDAVVLFSPVKKLKASHLKVIAIMQGENIFNFATRVCGELALGYEEVTAEKLSQLEKEFKENQMVGQIVDDGQIRIYLENFVRERSRFSPEDQVRVANQLFSSIRGFGILDELLADDEITEIMVNGKDNIYIEKAGKLIKTDYAFESESKIFNIIERIANRAGKQIDDSNPILDAVLDDGSRVNAILKGVCLNGPSITIRKFSKKPLSLNELLLKNSITEEAAEFLKMLVESRYNLIISGGTGSGKTTLAGACMEFIPIDERVITIEDTAELRLKENMNHVSLEARRKNSLGAGEINIAALIVSALRMRPDRIVVGEVRGKEAIDMLQAMNTGHDGSLTTAHANSPYDMLSRLETMVIQSNEIPLRAVRSQIASAVDVIVQVSRMRDGSRKVTEIVEILNLDEKSEIRISPIFKYDSKLGKLVRVGDLENVWKQAIYKNEPGLMVVSA